MSSLNSLILEIEKEKEEKKKELEKSYSLKLKEIDRDFQKELDGLEKSLQEEEKKEKESLIENIKEEGRFNLKMKKLSFKEEILKEAISKLKDSLESSPFDSREPIYRRKIEEIRHLLPSAKVYVSPSKKEEAKKLFSEGMEIIEDSSLKDQFLIKGERFFFELGISFLVDEAVSKNREILSLFK